MTKKSADINYISKDLFPKTYNRTMIDYDYIKQLEQENKQLKDNWNKLKEYLRDFDIEYLNEIMEHNLANTLENILSKMQELEQGVSDAKD